MSPSIDFTTVKGMDPVPAGEYTAEIIKATEGVSENKNEKIDLQWKILGGEHDGRIIFDTLTFAPSVYWRVKATLQALDFPKDHNGEVTSDMLVGKSAVLSVVIDQNDKTDKDGNKYDPRNVVKKVKPLTAKSVGSKGVKDLI